MGVLDKLSGATTVLDTQLSEQRLIEMGTMLEDAATTIDSLTESLADIELARDDAGWNRLTSWGNTQFSREGLRKSAELCRIMAIANPLMKRGISLRTSYVWAGGVQVSARATGQNPDNQAEQDVNSIVQAFLDDPETQRVLYSPAAFERNERILATDGNLFIALIPNPLTGWIRPRSIPFDEIRRVITNPEDQLEVRFFLREYYETTVENDVAGTSKKTMVKVLHPSIDYRPTNRPDAIGDARVAWDQPVAELNVNALDSWDFGVGDAFAALPWARGYGEILTDWAKLVKALSRFAFRATADTKGKAQNAAAKQTAANAVPGPTPIGGTAHLGPGQSLEAIPKTGATIDLNAGRPLAAMVAAGLDVPVTMLLADPGVTGARATAETLDRPTEDMATLRRNVWGDYFRRILGYVIDQNAKAPGGQLRRKSMTRDRNTGREVILLAGDTDRTIEITWPDLSETPLKDLVDAIKTADDTGKMPPLETLKLLLKALDVDDIDDLIDAATDENGQWIDPETTAGDVAARRFRDGVDPADALA